VKAKGWAIETADGEILAKTVSPTPRGAQVNWLYTEANINVTNDWTDGRIAIAFYAESSSRGVELIKVEITKDLTT
jgi:hypothetical protein